VLFTVQEYGSVEEPYTFPPRSGPFSLGAVRGPFECYGTKAHVVVFQDGGRFFQVFALFGAEASSSLRREVEESLDSFRVEPLPEAAQPAAACRSGKWIACPQAVWVYQMISRAKVFHLGHLGDRAIIGKAGERSFALWTDPIGSVSLQGRGCRILAGVSVCQLGDRLAWRAQGLVLSVQPARSPYESLHTKPELPSTSVLERLVKASQEVGVATDLTCDGKPANVVGTSGDDHLVGTTEDDVVVLNGGKDTYDARGGIDIVCMSGTSVPDKIIYEGASATENQNP
jgi:hypothetical protein